MGTPGGFPVGPGTPEQAAQWSAVANAQTPAEYAAAAQAAGLTGDAASLAQAGAAPVSAPTFEEQLAESLARNAALQDQINKLGAQFAAALQSVQGQLSAVQASVPSRVDPTTESATKVVQHFASLAASDAKNMLHSALKSHLVTLGLEELAKIL